MGVEATNKRKGEKETTGKKEGSRKTYPFLITGKGADLASYTGL